MSFLDELRSARIASVAISHEFGLVYRPGLRDVFVFFEGEDDGDFYLPHIRKHQGADRDIHSFVCDGKHGVMKVRSEVERKCGDLKRVLFFLDRDHDELVGIGLPNAENVYVTDYYSIESYFVEPEILEDILVNFIHIVRSDSRFARIRTQYDLSYLSFVKVMRPLMAWALCKRESGTSLNLENAKFEKWVLLNSEMIFEKKKGCFTHFRVAVGDDGTPVTRATLRGALRVISSASPKLFIRGKYELWFFMKFVNTVWRTLVGQKTRTGRRIKQSIQFTPGNIFKILGARVSSPASLDRFLNTTMGAV